MRPETAALPEGTVTVLSTDLVGSTLLNQRLGDEAATAVERELAALAQEQIDKQRGVVVKDTGDGLMVAFQSARRAVACAQEIQRAIARRNRSRADSAVQLRVGLHTGEVLTEDGGLHGETLIIAKRVETVAPAGGIFRIGHRPRRAGHGARRAGRSRRVHPERHRCALAPLGGAVGGRGGDGRPGGGRDDPLRGPHPGAGAAAPCRRARARAVPDRWS